MDLRKSLPCCTSNSLSAFGPGAPLGRPDAVILHSVDGRQSIEAVTADLVSALSGAASPAGNA